MLDQILNGGSSISLNILARTALIDEGEPFFEKSALNKVYLFKYPNFEVELSDLEGFDFNDDSFLVDFDRPVETAIFAPHNERKPTDGGLVIYLRQKNFEDLIVSYFGLDVKETGEERSLDVEKLFMLDEAPSLDPFLLKSTFDRRGLTINPVYLDLPQSEENRLKQLIVQKVEPIVSAAMVGQGGARSGGRSKRFVDAIWDPTLPEAQLFVRAFRLDAAEAENVFNGWKGVSYYQNVFDTNREGLKGVVSWFRSDASRPMDEFQNKPYMPQLEMLKQSVFKKIVNILRNVNQVFVDYDASYDMFMKDKNPIPFRNFLKTAKSRYWILGFCCSALIHCINIFDRTIGGSMSGRLNFEQLNDMLVSMQGTLSSQVSDEMPDSA